MGSRRDLLLEIAASHGLLRFVPAEEAAACLTSWEAECRAFALPPRPKYRRPPQLHRKNRPVEYAAPFHVPGTWISIRPHTRYDNAPIICQILAWLPPGVALESILTPEQRTCVDRHVKMGPSARFSRVVVSIPGSRRLGGSIHAFLAGEVTDRATVLLDPPRSHAFNRLSSPVAPGTQVSWGWHSSKGLVRHTGCVLAYIPAGVPILSGMPLFRLPWSVQDVSNQDRYLVQERETLRRDILCPAAHLIEGEILTSTLQGASLIGMLPVAIPNNHPE